MRLQHTSFTSSSISLKTHQIEVAAFELFNSPTTTPPDNSIQADQFKKD